MNIWLNGQAVSVACNTIAELIVMQQLSDQRIAVEHNGHLVPKGLHATTAIQNGDRIEIVIAVGGG